MTPTAKDFQAWCTAWRNSPDIINLRWWLENRKHLTLSDAQQRTIIDEVRNERMPVTAPELTDEDIFGKDQTDDMADERKRNAKGKPAAAKLLRELDAETIQGKLVDFIILTSDDINDVMDNFMMERHSIMTHLNIMARATGIGYSVTDGKIHLTLPDCHTPETIFEL